MSHKAKFHNPVPAAALTLLLLLLLTPLMALPAEAQILTLPRVSPHATVSQTVGLTEITVNYHRPSVNDRTLWGGLVPYGAVWRAGANENTTLRFSHPVTVGGVELPAGTYGLHMFPGEDGWQVALSSNASSWGSFSYDEAEDVVRVDVAPQPAPSTAEQLHYAFSDVTHDSATLTLHWGEKQVPVEITTDTDALVVASLREELRGIAQYNAQHWQQAAGYLAQNEIDDELALEWAERSVTMQPGAFNLSLQARLLERMGRGDEAAEALAQAERVATSENEVNLLGYAYLQSGDVERAIRTFQRNVDDHPESWNVHDSLAEAYAAAGRTADSIAQYQKAMEMAPEAQHPRIRAAVAQLEGAAGDPSAE